VLTRKNLNEATNCVASSQNIHEINFFVNRLKVKDIMNRMVKTVDINDTVEFCMLKGQKEKVSTFPVLENGHLVGLVSEVEIFQSLLQILGADEHWHGVTLEPGMIEPGALSKVAAVSAAAGAKNHAVFTMRMKDSPHKKIILRFEAEDLDKVVAALKEAGYKPVEVLMDVQTCRDNGNNNHGRITCPDPTF
jgi:acetoin utilization protein AcuB